MLAENDNASYLTIHLLEHRVPESPPIACPDLNTVLISVEAKQQWLLFQEPVQILVARSAEEVPGILDRVEEAVNREQLYAAGYISYESAPIFEASFVVLAGSRIPLAWFGLYRAAIPVTLPAPEVQELQGIDWKASVSGEEYSAAIDRIKAYIHEGDSYQVNYTFRLRASPVRDPWQWFLRMISAQGRTLGAYIRTEEWCICSASHELFFRLDGNDLLSRPMKGTVSRGVSYREDIERGEWLRKSEKNRAENLMIVDMIRNDMGRIARTGSVNTLSLFEIEKYPTLWQMTSRVGCVTDRSLSEIFGALFPCASITGAPKRRTMEIISEVESTPRGLYTGTIGFLAPNRQAQFNVAIRTVVISNRDGVMEYGTGGGIVWDSVTEDEYGECLAKAHIVTRILPEFSLLETMLWTPDTGCYLLEEHLRRLQASAGYFSIAMDEAALRSQIETFTAQLPQTAHRIRLFVDRQGSVTLETAPPGSLAAEYRMKLAARPVNSTNPFLYHKTTNRGTYESALADATDCEDILLWNEKGELTESCIANLVVELDGGLYTPPVACGLLPGVYRETLLLQGKISERIILLEDLPASSRIFLINSVRGMWEVSLEGKTGADPRSVINGSDPAKKRVS